MSHLACSVRRQPALAAAVDCYSTQPPSAASASGSSSSPTSSSCPAAPPTPRTLATRAAARRGRGKDEQLSGCASRHIVDEARLRDEAVVPHAPGRGLRQQRAPRARALCGHPGRSGHDERRGGERQQQAARRTHHVWHVGVSVAPGHTARGALRVGVTTRNCKAWHADRGATLAGRQLQAAEHRAALRQSALPTNGGLGASLGHADARIVHGPALDGGTRRGPAEPSDRAGAPFVLQLPRAAHWSLRRWRL